MPTNSIRAENGTAGNFLLAPARRFDRGSPELIDRPGVREDAVAAELDALARANRWLGGSELILYYFQQFVRTVRPGSLKILDLGTGSADIPRALVAWSRSHDLSVRVTAVDASAMVLGFAARACEGWPEIELQQHDMIALPYDADSFDVVMCSLALHHFEANDATQILRKVGEMARSAYLVNDLRRNWISIALTQLFAKMLIRNQTVKHDAISSTRAAFTVRELKAMADEAGLTDYRIRRHHFAFRMVLEGRK